MPQPQGGQGTSGLQSGTSLDRAPDQGGTGAGSDGPSRPQLTTQMFKVIVPAGVRPNQPFTFIAGGQRVLVMCPPNAYPGQKIRFAKFVRCLHLIAERSDRVAEDSHSTVFNSSASSQSLSLSGRPQFENLLEGGILARLDMRVLDLAYHLSKYPFPSQFLPPLPICLVAVERAWASRIKHATVSYSEGGHSWWDSTNGKGGQDTVALPDLPTGSASADGWKWSQAKGHDSRSGADSWSDRKYDFATAAS